MKLKIQSTYKTRTTGDQLDCPDFVVAQDVLIRIESAYLVTEVINPFGGSTRLQVPKWYYQLSFELSNGSHGIQFYSESLLFANDPKILEHEVVK